VGYEWSFNELKRSEGGPGVRAAVDAARKTGARAKREESVFVGHELIVVTTRTKAEMRRALAAIKRVSSMVPSVTEALRCEVIS
jgi:hypothetical protein